MIRRFSLLGLVGILLAVPAGRVFADTDAPLQSDIQSLKADVDAENARLQGLAGVESGLLGASTFYGSFSQPTVEAALSSEIQDIDGFGRAGGTHGTADTELLTLRITAQVDATQVQFEFDPSFSPAVVHNEGFGVAVDNQATMQSIPWAGPTPPGVLFDRAKLSFLGEDNSLTFGFEELDYSIYVLGSPLYARPDYFDPDPSAGRNTPSTTTWRETFDHAGYQVSADSAEPEFWGILDEMRLPEELTLTLFSGINEYYWLNGNAMHQDGARLQVDTFKKRGSMLNLLFVNEANDLGELQSVGVASPEDPVNGLQNSSASSLQYDQALGNAAFQGEMAYAYENLPYLTTQGLAWNADLSIPTGPLSWGLQGGYTAPGFIVADGGQTVTGMNSVSDEIFSGQKALYDTEISAPTSPMNNTEDWGATASLSTRFLHVSTQLLDHSQLEASSPVIESSHFLNGNNLTGGGWWGLFNNNYALWDPAPAVTENANQNLAGYNTAYLPASGSETDAQGRVYGDAYHELETNLWRYNTERLLTANANGQPLLPSRKNIAYANCDARFDLGKAFSMNQEVYLDLFQDYESVNDASLPIPDTNPGNLFNQDVGEATMVLRGLPRLYYLLSAGYEVWSGDRFPSAFANTAGQTVSGRLEYYERSAGVGLDWDISPTKLKATVRIKVFSHEDAANGQDDFSARQMLWELQSWF